VHVTEQAPASELDPACPTVESPSARARHTDLVIDDTLRSWTPTASISASTLSEDAEQFRRELGLPTDRPVVMTGHQAEFWHAGILAKYLAADAIASHRGSADAPIATAWCVPDHVAETPGRVAYPAMATAGSGDASVGEWIRAEIDLFTEDAIRETKTDISHRLNSARAALRSVSGARDSDTQIAAQQHLLASRLDLAPDAPPVLASRLHETTLFRTLVQRMRTEPDACVEAYNAAASAHPDAGVRPMVVAADRTELPLWRTDDAGRAHAVFLSDLEEDDESIIARLRPRALLFTGLLRAHACDLFIHGTGGGVYDRVTERWLADWLGWSLAPAGVATATLTLDLGVPDVSRTDLRDARWRAHHARHNPGAIGETEELSRAQNEKQSMVERIDATPRGERDPLYFEMHAMLERVRESHPEELAAIDERVRTVEAALADRAIAKDRTWAWFLHADEDLAALRSAIAEALRAQS
jgi:hypothetical protein